MTDNKTVEEIKSDLLECFDSGESFQILGLRLKRMFRFQLAILFEIDWNGINLTPVNFFPATTQNILSSTNVTIPLNSSVLDIFTREWIQFDRELAGEGFDRMPFRDIPSPFFLFPLKVKQRVMSAIGLLGVSFKEDGELENLVSLLNQLAPVIEKNMVIDKTVRKNQRLETILGTGKITRFVVNRAGYISDYVPSRTNFLGYTADDIIGRPISSIMPKEEAASKAIWKQSKSGDTRGIALLKHSSGKKLLASLFLDRVLLKYDLQREYYLIGVEPVEEKIYNQFSTFLPLSSSGGIGTTIIRIHYCPEALSCLIDYSDNTSYIGEGSFAVDNSVIGEITPGRDSGCIVEFSSISDNANSELIEK